MEHERGFEKEEHRARDREAEEGMTRWINKWKP